MWFASMISFLMWVGGIRLEHFADGGCHILRVVGGHYGALVVARAGYGTTLSKGAPGITDGFQMRIGYRA